ncbi:MAG: hypothetical protein RIR83_1729, partial [Pseudomonadota bacterium]
MITSGFPLNKAPLGLIFEFLMSNVIYHGFQYLFQSNDKGETWKRISDDLTYNDKSRMGRTPYAINHQAITAIEESPLKKGLLYVGTDDGRVWMRDGE